MAWLMAASIAASFSAWKTVESGSGAVAAAGASATVEGGGFELQELRSGATQGTKPRNNLCRRIGLPSRIRPTGTVSGQSESLSISAWNWALGQMLTPLTAC